MKYLFFDVDGTLLPFGRGVPDDTRAALAAAQENGNLIFLSTGRSPAEMDPRLGVISFDGGVCSGGARAFANGREIFSSYISREDLAFTEDLCAEHGWRLLVQCDDASWYRGDFCEMYESLLDRYVGRRLEFGNLIKTDVIPTDAKCTKLLLVTPDGDMEEARGLLCDRYDVLDNTVGIPSCYMAEVCQKNVNKGRTMKILLDYYGADISDSIAFGDGSNDIEIVQTAGIGVAMGNACEALKEIADYVTASCDEDGIGQALRHFGVI